MSRYFTWLCFNKNTVLLMKFINPCCHYEPSHRTDGRAVTGGESLMSLLSPSANQKAVFITTDQSEANIQEGWPMRGPGPLWVICPASRAQELGPWVDIIRVKLWLRQQQYLTNFLSTHSHSCLYFCPHFIVICRQILSSFKDHFCFVVHILPLPLQLTMIMNVSKYVMYLFSREKY